MRPDITKSTVEDPTSLAYRNPSHLEHRSSAPYEQVSMCASDHPIHRNYYQARLPTMSSYTRGKFAGRVTLPTFHITPITPTNRKAQSRKGTNGIPLKTLLPSPYIVPKTST
ncbi:hypothetical protein KC361_g130 [Hortaea werneckii]|nr:hypothetical protein KC361_g130 [Hortaea werneckii]